MKTSFYKLSLMSFTAITMLFTSCGKKDTVDSLCDEIISNMSEFADAMGSVKDKESAEAAAEKISTIGDELVAISKRLEVLEVPSDEEKKALAEKIDKAKNEVKEKINSANVDPGDKDVMAIMGKAMADFGKKMDSVKETFEKYGVNP